MEFEELKSVLCVSKVLKLLTHPSPDLLNVNSNFLLTAKSWFRGRAGGEFPRILS